MTTKGRKRLTRHRSHVYEGYCSTADGVNISLFPGVKVRLHHVHKVFGRSVSITGHVHDGERFTHSEEVHLLCVTLKKRDGEM